MGHKFLQIGRLPRAALILWALGFAAQMAAAQTSDQQYVAGLRQRRLFELADAYCRMRLADPAISRIDQADLLIQQVQSQVARAASLSLDQQPAAWDAARRTLADFLQTNADHPRREVLMVQHALTLFARGQTLRQEWQLDTARGDLKSLAAQTLREAVSELETAQRQIAELLPQRQRQRAPEELSTAQLMALQNNVQFQLAQCNLQSALLYGDDEKSARVDALTQIEERLDQLARRIQPDDPLAKQIFVMRIECQRRLGKVAEAESLASSTDDKTFPMDLKAELWSERFQLALAQDKTDAALKWLPEVAPLYTANPKLCLALVELFLTMAAKSNEDAERNSWQQRADQTIRVLETYHGVYWTRRANSLLLENASSAHRSPTGDLVLRLADELLRKQQPDEALRILDVASNKASAENNSAAAAPLAFRAAQIQQQRGQHQDAADRFRLLSAAFREQPQADEAHLSACWNVAQLVPKQPEFLEDYTRLLQEHLSTFPNGNTADQAAIWLAQLLSRKEDWLEAFRTAASVRPENPNFGQAATMACSAATAELARVSTADPKQLSGRAAEIDNALRDWGERAVSSDHADAIAQIKLTRIIIGLTYLSTDAPSAARELEQLEQSISGQDSNWRDTLRAWRALCLASAGESIPEAQLGALPINDSTTWLSVAESLRNEKNRSALAQLILAQHLRMSGQIAKGGVSVRWKMAQAESLWDRGESAQAVEEFSKLATEHPRVLEVQIRLARMLARDSNGKWTDKAIELWRNIGKNSEAHSEVWFSAKFELIGLLVQQGKLDEAEKILRYLKAVPPGWDQSALKNDFEQLLSEITRRKPN